MKIDIGRKQYLSFKATTYIGADLRTWLSVLGKYGWGMSWQFIPKAIIITIVTTLTLPFVLWERFKYDKKIRETEVKAPVFIIGHQRSGTTYLHYLIGRDPQFAFCSVKESFMPWLYLTCSRVLNKILGDALPETRPMDNLRLGLDMPTEPEYSLGNMTPISMIPGYYFPRRMLEVFRTNVVFTEGNNRNEWQRAMKYFMQKLTLKNNGKRLVIKSPENLGRIKELLEIFPDARFIHIKRDPYRVYFSTERLYGITLPLVSMQHIDPQSVQTAIMEYYKEIHEKFLQDRASIPQGQLAEIRYEDLIGNELEVLEKAYAEIGLSGMEEAREEIQNEVRSYANYKTNEYQFPEDRKREIYRNWQHVFEALGYDE